MKLIAYVLFVLSVLLVSAFARADLMMHPLVHSQVNAQVPVHVQKVDALDVARLQLYVSGVLPNACTADPVASLTLEDGTLVLRLSTPPQYEICPDRAKPFSLVINLPELAKQSDLELEPEVVYPVKTPGFDFLLNVSGAELLR